MYDPPAPDPRAYRGAPDIIQESMEKWPWELCLKNPWVVPEPADKRPRFFESEADAILACARLLRDPFDYVIRPRTSWNGTSAEPEDFERLPNNITGP